MSGIQRFLTRRERHGRQRKSEKDEASTALSRTRFRGFFASTQNSTPADKDEDKKIKQLERRIASLGITGLKREHYEYALRGEYASGDVGRAFEMLLLFEDAVEGIIREYSANTKLLGAVNRNGVTCYLDALLFAMFARLDCFEAILYKSFNDEPRTKLVIILRLWVNLLRSGKLISTDITRHLQEALAECGWKDAAALRQQDASEAFTFITGTLELPLLTLKMDIYHTGREDAADDHKFVNERLLEVAIPPEHADGSPLTLEDCLEAYFNNRIEVKRHMERRNTLSSVTSYDSTSKGFTTHVETVELGASSPLTSHAEESTSSTPIIEVNSHPNLPRRTSIVQERFIPDEDDHENESEKGHGLRRSRPRKGSIRKEVMMPAWQFFSLIPWYTDNTPTSDAQVAAHFSSKRPILGLCLKRYSMLPNGKAIRLNTYIDIPIEIGLPHFIQDDQMEEMGPIFGNFKLSLQSVVCHRGNSVDSGHYVALVRGTSPNAVVNAMGTLGNDTKSEKSEEESVPRDPWIRFDDLAAERVTMVDIEQVLKEESPYLLFYQIMPINEEADEDANHAIAVGPPSIISTDPEGTVDSNPISARASFELPRSGEEGSQEAGDQGQNTAVLDSAGEKTEKVEAPERIEVPQVAPENLIQPPAKAEERQSSNVVSRRNSKNTASRSRSRGDDQSAEKRLSATFSRIMTAGRLSKEKLGSSSNDTSEDPEAASKYEPAQNDGNTSAELDPKGKVAKGRAEELDKPVTKPNRLSRGDRKGKRPDRECGIM